MNDLFIRTMLKLQENKKVRSKKLLKEDIDNEDDIKDIQDVDGYEHDVITVMDPELSTDEFIEKQDEINKLIDETPEGEKVVDTEYVGMKIYQCPLCLTNFYTENEPREEEKCPVCYETPEQFIYLGTVEQDMNDEDKDLIKDASDEMEEPEEGSDNADESAEGEEPGTSVEDELNALDLEEEPEEGTENEEEEEDNRLTASKKVKTNGNVIKENKSLNENLQVGNELSFKIKNNIVSAEITNVYIDDFNDKTYIQYANPEGTRSGTMSADEILKGIEEGTIIAKVPGDAELPASVEEPIEEISDEVPVEPEMETSEIEDEPIATESKSKRMVAFDYKDLTEDMKTVLKATGKSEKVLERYWYDKAGRPIVEKKNARVRKSK